MSLDSQLPCRKLDFLPTEYGDWILRIPKHGHGGELRNNFLEQLQPLSNQLRVHLGQPGDVAARARQALNNPGCHRVTRSHHHDRDFPGSVFGSQSIVGDGSDDDINLKTDQIGDELREAIVSPLRISVLNDDSFSLNPSEVTEPLQEGLVPERCIGGREGRQQSYPGDFRRLLRARDERPRRRHAAEQRDELPPPHSITSSARASSEADTVSPSVLRVLRLMTSSNLVGCITGSSAGFAPLRIWPA